MALIKDRKVVVDCWRHAADNEPLPTKGWVIVSLARWQKEKAEMVERNIPLGICLKSDESSESIAKELIHFDLVALEFPTFRDGRPYSTARLLRERYDYKGELRAVGYVLRDQLLFMMRCGFVSFQYSGKGLAEEALQAFDEITVTYQSALDQRSVAAMIRNSQQ